MVSVGVEGWRAVVRELMWESCRWLFGHLDTIEELRSDSIMYWRVEFLLDGRRKYRVAFVFLSPGATEPAGVHT